MASREIQKLYCYVDETGQDARSRSFVVVAVVRAGEQDAARDLLLDLENATGTNHLKWHKTQNARRLKYLRLVLAKPTAGKVFFGSFEKPLPLRVTGKTPRWARG